MRILVTAGPTREPIDAVRFLSNRSTGKMGYAVAAAAGLRGHDVRLISGPVSLEVPPRVHCTRVTTAEEMHGAVMSEFPACDALVMVAAVADWRPRIMAAGKLKKNTMSDVLPLERTVDILSEVSRVKGRQIVVGFAAETECVTEEAARKRTEKKMDLVVANDVSQADSGFEVDTNRAVFIDTDGERRLPLMSKEELAGEIISWLETHPPVSRNEHR